MDAQQLQHSADDAMARAASRQKQANDMRATAEGKRRNGDETGAAVDEKNAANIEQNAQSLKQEADTSAAQVQVAVAKGHALQKELEQLRHDFHKREEQLKQEIQRISGNPTMML